MALVRQLREVEAVGVEPLSLSDRAVLVGSSLPGAGAFVWHEQARRARVAVTPGVDDGRVSLAGEVEPR